MAKRALSLLDFGVTLSLGYAQGFGNDLIPDDEEFMLSLKIL